MDIAVSVRKRRMVPLESVRFEPATDGWTRERLSGLFVHRRFDGRLLIDNRRRGTRHGRFLFDLAQFLIDLFQHGQMPAAKSAQLFILFLHCTVIDRVLRLAMIGIAHDR